MSNEMELETKTTDEATINIDYYRKVVQKYLELNRFRTAQFWAEKVVTLSNEAYKDVYWLALTLYSSKEYHRAAQLLTSKNLHCTNAQCCYLAAACLSEAKNYNDAMKTLAETCVFVDEASNSIQMVDDPITADMSNVKDIALLGNSLLSCIHLERGRVYEALDNREFAAECFKEALKADVFCYEAFEALIQHQMLPSKTEAKLISMLPFNRHCPTQVDQDLVKYLYESKLNKYRAINTFESSAPAWLVSRMADSLDQMVADAERHFYNCNIKQCYRLTQDVMARDPYHLGCLPVHISCLVEQKKSNDLFLLAHKLVDIYPENGISWFAVGCYYYIIGKRDSARRYLGKATTLDKLFGPAWLAYGHSFAADTEHDQAMAAYFKAAQLMIGCHLPFLYIGLENGLAGNEALADKFFEQALEIAPNDPFVLHEKGVIFFQSARYDKARQNFEQALSLIKTNEKTVLQRKWEPLLNNLGHTYRKLQLYDLAIDFHKQAMVLMPNSYSTHAAIGFCEILMGKRKLSIETFHKALSLKRDDTFSSTMLNYVLELQIQDSKESIDAELPIEPVKDSLRKADISGKDMTIDSDDSMMKHSSSDLRSSSMRLSDRLLAGSLFSSSEPSFVIDVINSQERKKF